MRPNPFSFSIVSFFRKLLQSAVYLFTLQWLVSLIRWIRALLAECRRRGSLKDIRRGQPTRCAPRCVVVPPQVYKRADPLIYSQLYLMEQGLAVTWDNPDIQLYDNGVAVPSQSLKADHDYEVVATVHNNSTQAPAVGLPVEFSFLSFGVGTVSHPIGTIKIDLPAKGAAGHPASAKIHWHTPAGAGHYCLQARLIWPDDVNPKNNLGQENTNVGVAASPAVFTFPVRNDSPIRRHVRMAADTYVIPPPLDCRERPRLRDSDRRYPDLKRHDVYVPPTEREADWTLARARHRTSAFPIPPGWTVTITPPEFDLPAGATRDVQVSLDPPDSFRGEQPFNINALYGTALLGGVTLRVRR